MTDKQDRDDSGTAIGRLWRRFWQPSSKYGLGAILIAGGFLGVIFWGGFNTFMEYTNTLQFCTSCHEMKQLVSPEYKSSLHYSNTSGVRAICSDCHVPKPWGPKLLKKIRATNELFHKILGSVNTKEKFEAKRLEMAQHVWASMKETDSRECRNCHDFGAMDTEEQIRPARKKHTKAIAEGQTCIDCHKGVVHELPRDYEPE